MNLTVLPHFQASMNTVSTILLLTGFYFIKNDNRNAHMKCMISALATSSLFLVSYLTYHYYAGTTRFGGEGWIRPAYFAILLTHTILAIAIVPMVLVTLWRAVKGRFEAHRKIARWTLPVWLYVSVTGVIIYYMLYHLYPPAG
jgi:putative membrane protein